MSFSKLNVDVLNEILAFVEPREALDLCTVSHAMYGVALRRRLAIVMLGHGPRKTLQFCAFILSDSSTRIPMLRGITFSWSAFCDVDPSSDAAVRDPTDLDASAFSAFTSILEKAHSLAFLCISDLEPMLSFSPSLSNAIAGLPNLRRLILMDYASEGQALLRRMKSDVRDLALCRATFDFIDLSRFVHLERLKLWILKTDKISRERTKKASQPLEWRELHTLGVHFSPIPLAYLASVFPNVHNFSVSAVDVDSNSAKQAVRTSSWPKLDHIDLTSSQDSRNLPNTTRVLKILDNDSSFSHKDNVLEILRNISCFHLSFSIGYWIGGTFWAELAEAGKGQLKSMTVTLCAQIGSKPDVASWTVNVLPLLKCLPLKMLSVEVERRWSLFPGDPLFEELGMKLAETIPSLCCVSLRNSSYCADSTKPSRAAWIVSRSKQHDVLKLHPFLLDSNPQDLHLLDEKVESLDQYLEPSGRWSAEIWKRVMLRNPPVFS